MTTNFPAPWLWGPYSGLGLAVFLVTWLLVLAPAQKGPPSGAQVLVGLTISVALAVTVITGLRAAQHRLDQIFAQQESNQFGSQRYHLLFAVRGDLLAKLGRMEEARSEFELAAALTRNARERDLLLARAADCVPAKPASAPS